MRDNSSAAVRPGGPAPTIKTGSVMTSLRLAWVAAKATVSTAPVYLDRRVTNCGLSQRWVQRAGSIRRVKTQTKIETGEELTQTPPTTSPTLFFFLCTPPS